MTHLSSTMEEARRVVLEGPANRLLESLVDRIGGRAGVHVVFSEPVERGDVTIVGVARVRWGFGGGGGTAGDDAGGPGSASGSGGGGGVAADPVGYLEIGPAGARFERVGQPYSSPLFLLALGMATAIVLRALTRLIRG